MADSYIVKPVAKALQVLEYVAEQGRELTLTEVATGARQPKTTAFRYLQTLCHAGFVAYDAQSDRYRTGIRLWALGQSAGSRSVLAEIALPTMRRLRDQFNETVNLAELDGADVVYLEMVESRRSLRMQAKIGHRDPAYCTAVGKALLAFTPEERWPEHLPPTLGARTPETITRLLPLRKELLLTRERGYALDEGENEEGSSCVGAPLFYPPGSPIAALSVSAPASRVTNSLKQQIAQALVEATAEVSQRLVNRDFVREGRR